MLSWDLAILFCIYVNNCWNLGDVRATYFIIAVVGAREFWEEFTQALGVARKIFLIFGVWWRVGRSCMIWWADSSEGGVKIRTYPFCALVDDCALILIGCLCGMRNIFVECFVLVGSTVDNIGSGYLRLWFRLLVKGWLQASLVARTKWKRACHGMLPYISLVRVTFHKLFFASPINTKSSEFWSACKDVQLLAKIKGWNYLSEVNLHVVL
jgi:hypothetical protein